MLMEICLYLNVKIILSAKSHQLDLLLYMLDSLDKVALVMDSPKKLSSISRNV